MSKSNYEILIYLSDQHAAGVAGFMGDPIVRTPHLDQLAQTGSVFRQAYTACPLCAPTRASMMTGRMPSELGMFGNDDAFNSQHGTFVHGLSAAGYETVLCGRMHFVGEEQNHGFERRVARDFSPGFWGNPSENRAEIGDFGRSVYQKWCLEVIGEGDSPVRAYDRYVTQTAISYLAEEHSRPQMLLVGTYAPHFPYMGDPKKMEYYRTRVMDTLHHDSADYPMDAVAFKCQYPSREDLIELRSAYYAMVEEMDERLGQVYEAWKAYLVRKGTRGIFVYLSDHGDQIGEKSLFGKQTFFEYSAKIPMIIQIDGEILPDVEQPSSILDLGNTLCALAGAQPPPLSQGTDWSPWLLHRERIERGPVYSEYFDRDPQGKETIGVMVRDGKYKYISYTGLEKQDLLFDTDRDPDEVHNIIQDHQQTPIFRMLARAEQEKRITRLELWRERRQNAAYLSKWGKHFREQDPALWVPPVEVRTAPQNSKRKIHKP